jgi:hypothetical protein
VADQFISDRFSWLNQVATDRSLPPSAARVAIVLGGYVNRVSGDAWPSVETLSASLGIVENCVRKALKAMVRNGHLTVDTGGGRKSTNRYRPVVKDQSNDDEKPRTDVRGFGEEKPRTDVRGLEKETLHGRSQNPARAFTKPCTPVHPNYYRNNFKKIRAPELSRHCGGTKEAQQKEAHQEVSSANSRETMHNPGRGPHPADVGTKEEIAARKAAVRQMSASWRDPPIEPSGEVRPSLATASPEAGGDGRDDRPG